MGSMLVWNYVHSSVEFSPEGCVVTKKWLGGTCSSEQQSWCSCKVFDYKITTSLHHDPADRRLPNCTKHLRHCPMSNSEGFMCIMTLRGKRQIVWVYVHAGCRLETKTITLAVTQKKACAIRVFKRGWRCMAVGTQVDGESSEVVKGVKWEKIFTQ